MEKAIAKILGLIFVQDGLLPEATYNRFSCRIELKQFPDPDYCTDCPHLAQCKKDYGGA